MKKGRITGYRLHKERLLFSGGEVIRTVKYPLVSPKNSSEETKQFLKKFEDAVIADDLKIRGDLNLNDYLAYTAAGKTSYTLFDFWVDSLKAGVIWKQKPKELIDFLSTKAIDLIWEKASGSITNYFEKNKFKEILKSIPIRKGKTTRKSFSQRLVNCVKKEFVVKNKNGTCEVFEPNVTEEINSIVDKFFDENDNLILEGKFQQSDFWKNKYNLDISILQAAQPSGEYKDITFIIIPELILDLTKNYSLEELIVKREKWLKEFKGSEREIDSILCLTANFNGFSNYLGKVLQGLQSGKLEEIFKAQKTVLPSIEQNKAGVMNALQFLSDKSRLLGEVALPLVNGWHEYRSVFGGKLQSWFTNSQKRKLKLDEQIAKFKESLLNAKKHLQKQQLSDDVEKEKQDILDLLSLLEKFFTDDSKSIKTEENYQIFDTLLALVKRRLNFFYQAYIQKEGDETTVKKFPAFKGIYEKIDKPVAFYGDSARRANEKFVNQTIPILEDGIENIRRLLAYLKSTFSAPKTFELVKKDKETPEDSYRKFLQFFWNKYTDGSTNSSIFRKKYEEILQANTDDTDWKELQNKEKRGRYVFYKSPYAKGSLQEVKIKSDDYLEKLGQSVLLLTDFLFSFEKEGLLKDARLVLDWIELSKTIISSLLRFNTKESYELGSLLLDNFPQVKRYLELFGKRQCEKNEFSFIVQSLILSEVRAVATLYSKKEYTARYSVQVVGSDDKFKLYYIPSNSSITLSKEIITSSHSSDKRKQLMKPHYYALVLGNTSVRNRGNLSSVALGKKEIKLTFWSDEEASKLFRLSSSPYQLQFLDKYLYRPKGWENMDITLGEWSFIVERRYKVEWNLGTKKPRFSLATNEKEKKKNKLYVAIPFNLKPVESAQKSAPLKEIAKGKEKDEKDLSRLNYPILGIDVGEYGLAYCLVEFNYDKNTGEIFGAEILKDKRGKEICGFIEDRNIANIKDRFVEIQQRAKQGAFDEEDTTVARVRENAIGALRNRIHIIVTRQGASAVYEDSISNFETGSGRTTKIYNSVKRADTEFESEADKQIHKHVWGDGAKWVGRNISAYASSYTCARCLHSLYEVKKSDLSKIKVLKPDGRIVAMAGPCGEIKGYLSGKEKEKYQEGYQFKDTDEDLKAFRKIVRDFARPPVNKENSEVLKKYARGLLEEFEIEEFRERRGNSAIFVCPFCQFVADADIQAAFMMAVRGYLRFSGIVPSAGGSSNGAGDQNTKTAGESFLEQTAKHLKDLGMTHIIDTLSLRI